MKQRTKEMKVSSPREPRVSPREPPVSPRAEKLEEDNVSTIQVSMISQSHSILADDSVIFTLFRQHNTSVVQQMTPIFCDTNNVLDSTEILNI